MLAYVTMSRAPRFRDICKFATFYYFLPKRGHTLPVQEVPKDVQWTMRGWKFQSTCTLLTTWMIPLANVQAATKKAEATAVKLTQRYIEWFKNLQCFLTPDWKFSSLDSWWHQAAAEKTIGGQKVMNRHYARKATQKWGKNIMMFLRMSFNHIWYLTKSTIQQLYWVCCCEELVRDYENDVPPMETIAKVSTEQTQSVREAVGQP